jgi:hypothetical protein
MVGVVPYNVISANSFASSDYILEIYWNLKNVSSILLRINVAKVCAAFYCWNLRVVSKMCFISLLYFVIRCDAKAVPWLKRLVAGLSPRRPGFAPGSIHVGFVVDKV